MTIDAAFQPPTGLSSGRFFRTGYLPTFAGAFFLLVLLMAGAPGKHVDFTQAWQAASKFGVAQTLLVVLAVTLTTVLLQPLQLSAVRFLEGNFPWWLGSGLARRAELARKHRWERTLTAKISEGSMAGDSTARIQEAGELFTRLRSRYPVADHLVRPTALGNALAAMEDSAGAAYGFDSVVVWPRLYPLLSDRVKAVVDDLRDGMDAAVRLTATGVTTAAAAAAILAWRSGIFTLLAMIPLAVAPLAYLGAIRAAISYGGSVTVAFDLHRFDLLAALHLETPAQQDKEVAANTALSDFLRQGVPLPFDYAAPAPSTGSGATAGSAN